MFWRFRVWRLCRRWEHEASLWDGQYQRQLGRSARQVRRIGLVFGPAAKFRLSMDVWQAPYLATLPDNEVRRALRRCAQDLASVLPAESAVLLGAPTRRTRESDTNA